MQPHLAGGLRDVRGGDGERFVRGEALVARGTARVGHGDAQARGNLRELRREIREEHAVVTEVDGVVVAMTAEVEDQRDLVGPVPRGLDARLVDGGEQLRARRLGEHERVLGPHAAEAHHDVTNARRVGRRELERALRREADLAAGGHENAHGLRQRGARDARDAERHEPGHQVKLLHGLPSHSTRSADTPSSWWVARARATASGLPITIVP